MDDDEELRIEMAEPEGRGLEMADLAPELKEDSEFHGNNFWRLPEQFALEDLLADYQ